MHGKFKTKEKRKLQIKNQRHQRHHRRDVKRASESEDENMMAYRGDGRIALLNTSGCLGSICECFVNRRTRGPTFFGWILLLILGFVLANVYLKKGNFNSFGSNDLNDRPDLARFHGQMLPKAPNPGIGNLNLAAPKNLADLDQPRDPQIDEFI